MLWCAILNLSNHHFLLYHRMSLSQSNRISQAVILTLFVMLGPFLGPEFAAFCNSITRQPIEQPSTDSERFPVYLEKNIFDLGLGFAVGGIIMGHIFAILWLRLPGPGHQPNRSFFLAQGFLESRLSSKSLEPLIGFLAYMGSKLWLKLKIGKNSIPTNADPGYITPILYIWP